MSGSVAARSVSCGPNQPAARPSLNDQAARLHLCALCSRVCSLSVRMLMQGSGG